MPFSLFSSKSTTTNAAEGSTESESTSATSLTASARRASTPANRGLHPMKFPKDERIPVTEKELKAQGVKFCFHKILAQNQCLAKAKEAYLTQGGDPNKGPDWYYFHLRMCFDAHKAANQCVIDHKEQELRERQKRIREKKTAAPSLA